MKVKAEEKSFGKVVITLETVEELRALYHVLGTGKEESLEDRCKDEEIEGIEEIDQFAEDLFIELDDIVDEKEYEV